MKKSLGGLFLETKAFYDQLSPEDIRLLSGAGMHYHHGIFWGDSSFEQALDNAVRVIYPYVPLGASVLDLGCGWGGVAAQLKRDLKAKVICVTNSDRQARFVKGQGFDVVVHDLESGIPDIALPKVDVVMMFESLEHIANKSLVISQLTTLSDVMIIRINCTLQSQAPGETTFGQSMITCSPDDLIDMIHSSGWQVVKAENLRMLSVPSLYYWEKRILECYGDEPLKGHVRDLLDYSRLARASFSSWIESNPLMNIVAVREGSVGKIQSGESFLNRPR